jgi:hypothetical protein
MFAGGLKAAPGRRHHLMRRQTQRGVGQGVRHRIQSSDADCLNFGVGQVQQKLSGFPIIFHLRFLLGPVGGPGNE